MESAQSTVVVSGSSTGRERGARPRARLFWHSLVVFLCGAVWSHGFFSKDLPIIINDSAVEILQARDMPAWPPRALAGTYNGSLVDFIESGVPYIYKLSVWLGRDNLQTYQVTMQVIFGFTCALFFIFLLKRFDLRTAYLGAGFYIVSSYSLWPCLLLTRNGASSAAALWWILAAESWLDKKSIARAAVWALASLAAILVYSSLKLFVAAGFSLVGLRLLYLRNWKALFSAFAIAGTAVVGLWLLMLDTGYKLPDFVQRGNYVLPSLGQGSVLTREPLFFLRCLLLPLWQSPSGFLAEPAHLYFGRGMLSPFLWPLFSLGLIRLAMGKRIEGGQKGLLYLWLLASIFLAVAGPSLKTNFVVWPLVVTICVVGLDWVLRSPYLRGTLIRPVIVYGLLLCIAAKESTFLRTTVRQRALNGFEMEGWEFGKWTRTMRFDHIYFYVFGVDLARFNIPHFIERARFTVDAEEFRKARVAGAKETRTLFVAPAIPEYWTTYDPDKCFNVTFGNAIFRVEPVGYSASRR